MDTLPQRHGRRGRVDIWGPRQKDTTGQRRSEQLTTWLHNTAGLRALDVDPNVRVAGGRIHDHASPCRHLGCMHPTLGYGKYNFLDTFLHASSTRRSAQIAQGG